MAIAIGLLLVTSGRETAPAPGIPTAPAGARVVAAVYADGGRIAELEARTLRTVQAAEVGFPPSVAPKSPDGSTLAVGSANAPRVRLVDRVRMRAGAKIALSGRPGPVEGLAWPAERQLIAFVGHQQPRVVVVDPESGRRDAVHELDGSPVAWQATAHGLVLLVAPRGQIGTARVVVVDAHGYRATVLTGVRAGWEASGPSQKLVPGLAADPSGRRAVVVPPGDRVAEIDLATLAVRHRELRRRVSLLGRLRDWLEPSASAKAIDGPLRTAVWVGRHHVAVSGIDAAGRNMSPAGAELVDTRDWTARTLTRDASAVAASGGTVLTFGGGQDGNRVRSVGLLAFDVLGRKRFHVFRARYVGSIAVAGRYGYLTGGSATRFEVVDLRTGRVVRIARTRATTVVLGSA